MRLTRKIIPIFAASVLAISATAASAVTLSFSNITGNNAVDAAIGEAQITVDVTDAGGGIVDFKFNNVGPNASSIVQTYWDDDAGILDSISSITNSAGVAFSQNASPPNLPGGNTIDFDVNPMGALADADSPKQPNGVNPGEMLVISFSLIGGKTFADLEMALEDGLGGNDLGTRIGIHVQGYDSEGSESFVNGGCIPGTPDCDDGGGGGNIPLPAGLPLLASGLLAIGVLGSRRRRS